MLLVFGSNIKFCFLKSYTDLSLIKQWSVEALCKMNCGIIKNMLVLLYTNYMLCATFMEYASHKFRLTCCYEYNVQRCHSPFNYTVQYLFTDKLSLTTATLEQKESTFILWYKAHLLLLFVSMTRDVQDLRIMQKHIRKVFFCSNHTHVSYVLSCFFQSLFDCLSFFHELKLGWA